METNEIWENTEQRLKQLIVDPKGYLRDIGEDEEDDPISVFLSNDVLEIKREQSYGSKGWTTSFYTFIEIDTMRSLMVKLESIRRG